MLYGPELIFIIFFKPPCVVLDGYLISTCNFQGDAEPCGHDCDKKTS